MIREGAKVAELDSTKGDLSEELQKIRKSHVDDPERFPEEQVNKEIQQIIIHQLNERFEKQGLPLDAMLSPEGTSNYDIRNLEIILLFRHLEPAGVLTKKRRSRKFYSRQGCRRIHCRRPCKRSRSVAYGST